MKSLQLPPLVLTGLLSQSLHTHFGQSHAVSSLVERPKWGGTPANSHVNFQVDLPRPDSKEQIPVNSLIPISSGTLRQNHKLSCSGIPSSLKLCYSKCLALSKALGESFTQQ